MTTSAGKRQPIDSIDAFIAKKAEIVAMLIRLSRTAVPESLPDTAVAERLRAGWFSQ
ncbi:hypothetical protein [Aquisalimonas sp.]|uniref:hypothetical protein n=1 Tax=Aquisalimonas sp. TaxID=1872621 RepID=UPI0025C5CC4E|nr:hypothetical protein [Aquisalimonas sp.]